VFVNGVAATESNHRQAYVEQTDNFYSMLTVAETLTMTSQLQLPATKTDAAKAEYVDNLINVLGLAKVGLAAGPAGLWPGFSDSAHRGFRA
jgi:ABC-type multidrug transport system ATPase subunit